MVLPIIHTLQISFLSLLFFTFLLHTTISYTPLAKILFFLLTTHLHFFLLFSLCTLISLYYYYHTRPHRVFLLNYTCYKPPLHRKCSYKISESYVLKNVHLVEKSIDFMRNIYLKSGLGDETYGPPFIFEDDDGDNNNNTNNVPTLKSANQEAREGVFSSIDELLGKTLIDPQSIDVVIVTCGGFSPSPSLSSLIVNRYNLRSDVKTYNLSGMGCSSGVLSIDFAARVLRGSRKVQNALVVITESITLNWYHGENRSMLVTNCIFRVGCAAAIMSNNPKLFKRAKMELVHSLRTHHGADDSSYRAAIQEEDEKGNTGISLTKDLVRVAGVNLRQHIKILAPRVLPLTQITNYIYSMIISTILPQSKFKPMVPDFTTAFEHMCIHTGGKAVIEQVSRVLKLSDEVTEAAKMTLNRFGNTSSSLVFYELAYFEAQKGKVKKGDKMWMIAFGTGFKVGSLVWKWIQDSTQDCDNPWNDCIHNYPLKVW
ncbi:3-ketoacyl-CoA synthase 17-like [Solanum verrucosum]|uniref:3-ketoacyl-CoA synthase 17-like n=1 Tax=Solanum verrucosum TaxID=315347 RepID=UPI0020D0CE59|nr:3-ketoacyl-CoA synthase 17-like [Solanum verrucosum]